MRIRPYFTPRRRLRRVTATEILGILAREKVTSFGGTVSLAAHLSIPAGDGRGEGEKQRPPETNVGTERRRAGGVEMQTDGDPRRLLK